MSTVITERKQSCERKGLVAALRELVQRNGGAAALDEAELMAVAPLLRDLRGRLQRIRERGGPFAEIGFGPEVGALLARIPAAD